MLRAVIRSMRPKQWVKSIFLFVALVFDRKLLHLDAFLRTLIGAVLFSLMASAVYIINDIADIESDRNHPKKRHRPIASGKLPTSTAWVIGVGLMLASLTLAYLLEPAFMVIGVLYLALNLSYSTWLKHIPLLDVLILASFYVLRVQAGVTLIEVKRFSPWLYVVTTLFALFIGFGKRRAELSLLSQEANQHRSVFEGYTIDLLDQLITIVSGTTIVAYSLYTFSAPNLPENHAMMLTIPFVLYGLFRYLYLLQMGKGGAPEEIAYTDRPLQVSILLWSISILVIFYIF
ncbi:MAG: decaprenyl-phosphate phosphoribosyltransferase [Anaerolineales bacterium]|nr:decaprenyl-phosphate phosphoribosyltransferase [Anaerolineales bacterium]MBS3753729.1 decaprenyl-phosphate phosphoribosyltransferase [Anaerolineales bacterium]